MENKVDNIRVGDYTLKEWEDRMNTPAPTTSVSFDEAESMGLMTPDDRDIDTQQPQNQFYGTLDQLGIEHPYEGKEYEKLGAWATAKDIGKSLFTEASHILMPKDMELQYESKTHIGEFTKYGYRYVIGTLGFMLGGGAIGGAIRAIGAANKLSKVAKTGKILQKLLSGKDMFKNATIGQKIANATLSGSVAGALADYNLYRPEENEGHLADVFGDTNNALISYLQTKDTDSENDARLKNVVEGLVIGAGVGNAIEFGLKPLFKSLVKNAKAFKNGEKGAAEALVQDQVRLERFASKVDLIDKVKELKAEADANGQEASQLLIDRLHPSDNPEAQEMLKILEDGGDIFPHTDGTWAREVTSWEDAQKVPFDEYQKQIKAKDPDGTEGLAISHMNQAVESTWRQRGLVDGDGLLSKSTKERNNTVSTIVDYYKNQWDLGKNKITIKWGDWDNIPDGKTSQYKNGNILIQLNTNSKDIYATFRAELEHARDFIKGEVPKGAEVEGSGVHVSRYVGDNEAEYAPQYTYKKSKGKAKASELEQYQPISKEELDNYEVTSYKDDAFGIDNPDKLEPDYEPYTIHNITNEKGENLAHLRIKYGNYIDWRLNHGVEDGAARKLIAKLLYDNKYGTLVWDATSEGSVKSYERFCREFPDLVDRIQYTDKYTKTVDINPSSPYNPEKGVSNGKGSNQLSEQQPIPEEGRGNKPNDSGQKGLTSPERQESVRNRGESSGNSTVNAGRENSVNNSRGEQLKLDFAQAVESKQSVEDIVSDITKGKLKLETKADVIAIINKAKSLNPDISNFSWKRLTENSEAYAKVLSDLIDDGDIEGLIEALAKQDPEMITSILTTQLAGVETLGKFAKAGKKLGTDIPTETKSIIINAIKHISNYTTEVKKGLGGGLEAQKLVNAKLEEYGATRLSSWTKEGIANFSQALIDTVNEIVSLNFTRGTKLNPTEMRQGIVRALLEREDTREFVTFLLNNEEMKADYIKTLEKLLKNPETANMDSVAKALTDLINSAEYNAMFKAAQLAPDEKGFFKTIKDWCDGQGGFTSYYVHNLLSGVGSLAKNIGSGAINTVYFPARKILASIDPFIDQATRESLGREGWRTYKCMLQSWKESWQLMKEAFISGEGKLTNIGENTMNMTDGKFKGFHGLQKFDYYFQDASKFWEGCQNFHSIMTRAMGATDEFMSQLNYRAITRAKSLQEAEMNAIEAGMKDNEVWINQEADRIFKEKFNSYGQPTDVEALNEARTILYQNNLDGTMYDYKTGEKQQMRDPSFVMKLAGSLQGMANENGFMKCMFPFVKTGANILQMSLDHNAIYMAASPLQRKLLSSQTAEGAIARSQCAFGMFSLGIGAMMAFNGLITGSAPSDPQERKALFATGWKPYSFKFGDNYISYQGYEPLHGMLGFAADCANMYSTITNPEDEARLKHFQAQILPTLVNNFLDKAAFRTGMSQLDLVLNPQNADEWSKAMAQTVKGFLPDVAFVTNTKSIGKHDVLQPQTFLDRVLYRYFPEGWTPMDYRRNVFGEKQSITGLLISSMGQQDGTPEEDALEYLSRYGYTPSEIDDVMGNTGLKISSFKDPATHRSAMDAMKEEMSTLTIGGKTLREALRELVTSADYETLPDGVDLDTGARWGSGANTKINAVNDVFLMYKQKAKRNIMKDSDYFTDSQGRTMSEASKEIRENRLLQLNNLY